MKTWDATRAEKQSQLNLAEAEHNTGLALNEKAKSIKSNQLAHLYTLHALSKLSKDKDPQLYRQITERVLASPVHFPFYRTQDGRHHEDSVSSIVFSPDGKTLASGSGDRSIGIWDLATNNIELTGLTLGKNGEYTFELDRLPYRRQDIDLVYKPSINLFARPLQPLHWSRNHPLHWLPIAERGDSKAMVELGQLYERSKDYQRALHWYRQAMEKGDKQGTARLNSLQAWIGIKRAEETIKEVESFPEKGEIEEALAVYEKALLLAPELIISSNISNRLCWFGSLTGNAVKALVFCDKAVELRHDNYQSRDSRGLARALTDDFQGAIEDFQFAVEHSGPEKKQFKEQRESWIQQLQAGENPFTEEQLQKLRNE